MTLPVGVIPPWRIRATPPVSGGELRGAATLPVPDVARSAHMAHEPVQAGRLRRNESGKRSACRADAREERGRSAIRRRDATGAAGTEAIGAGRYPDQAKRTVAADAWRITGKGGCAWAERRPKRTRERKRANARRIAPAAERTDAKSAGTRNGRARTQSNDCGAARDVSVTALSRADVPLGRCGKHADRHTRTQRPTHTAHQRTQPHPHRERRQTHS